MARSSWVQELKQRHVVRAAIIYAAAVWALAQGISQLSPVFGMSARVTIWFVIVCAIGFPFWLAFAWYFKFTSHGIERESEVAPDAAAIRRTGRRLDYWIIGILVIAVVLLLTNQLVLQRGKTIREFTAAPAAATSFSPPADSIVVLPFTNLGDNLGQQYFSDGITQELTGALGENTALRVIAWETASTFRNPKLTATEIGKQLNVANLLHGTIEREGDAVRVSVELVDTENGYELWSAHYNESFKDIFAVQDKISAAISGVLKVKFASLGAAPTTNPEAHDIYLKGLAALDRFTAADDQAAQDYFRQALKLDPNYADAWAGLAYSYVRLSEHSTLPLKEADAKARSAAEKALALDPNNANALVELGNVDDNIAQAKSEYEQALKLNPSNALAHLDYGNTLPPRQMLTQQQEAARLDPDNVDVQYNLADDYLDLGQYRPAVTAAEMMIRLSPHVIAAAFYLAFAYTQLHSGKDAVKAFDRVRPATALDQQLVDAGRLSYRALLQPVLRPAALAALDKLRQVNINPSSQGLLIQLYMVLDEKQTALRMLRGACAALPVVCSDLAVNPVYAPLHGDPRFEKLAKRYSPAALSSLPAPASAN